MGNFTRGGAELARRYWFFAPVLLAMAAFFASAGLRGPSAAETEAHYLSALSVTARAEPGYSVERRFAGQVIARQDADLGFEQAGLVAEVRVNDGDRVQAGQLLAQLDTELLATEADQLRAQLDDTQARQRLNQSNIERHQALQAGGFASQQRLDELHTEQQTLAAGLAALNAGLARVQSRMAKSQLRAPFDGVVARRFVDQGTVVNAGSPAFRLQQSGTMEVAVGVPVRFALQLSPAQPARVWLRGEAFETRVLSIGADVNTVTNTVNVRLQLPPEARAFNGDLAQLAVTEAIEQPGFWLTNGAIADGLRGRWTVYVLQARDQELYEVEARDVQIHHAEGDQVYVSGALSDGEQLVAAGVHRFVPGQKVVLSQLPVEAQLGQREPQ